MGYISNEDLAQVAARLGHTGLEIYTAPSGFWRVRCDCGYESTRRRTAAIAAQAAVHHVDVALRAYNAAGRPPLSQVS